jgi:RimJ/RimL family protein N-acetyltransferase
VSTAQHDQGVKLCAIAKTGLVGELGVFADEAAELVATTVQAYQAAGYVPPWIGYLAVAQGHVVGRCAFKGPPRNSTVEITVFTLPRFEGKGYATAMARELVAIAHGSGNPPRVAAQIPAVEGAASSVLRKAGFVRTGTFHHPHTGKLWNWEGPKKSQKKA